jgi:hypothetical protein
MGNKIFNCSRIKTQRLLREEDSLGFLYGYYSEELHESVINSFGIWKSTFEYELGKVFKPNGWFIRDALHDNLALQGGE